MATYLKSTKIISDGKDYLVYKCASRTNFLEGTDFLKALQLTTGISTEQLTNDILVCQVISRHEVRLKLSNIYIRRLWADMAKSVLVDKDMYIAEKADPLVISSIRRNVTISVHWAPPELSDAPIIAFLSQFGQPTTDTMEIQNYEGDFNGISSGIRRITLDKINTEAGIQRFKYVRGIKLKFVHRGQVLDYQERTDIFEREKAIRDQATNRQTMEQTQNPIEDVTIDPETQRHQPDIGPNNSKNDDITYKESQPSTDQNQLSDTVIEMKKVTKPDSEASIASSENEDYYKHPEPRTSTPKPNEFKIPETKRFLSVNIAAIRAKTEQKRKATRDTESSISDSESIASYTENDIETDYNADVFIVDGPTIQEIAENSFKESRASNVQKPKTPEKDKGIKTKKRPALNRSKNLDDIDYRHSDTSDIVSEIEHVILADARYIQNRKRGYGITLDENEKEIVVEANRITRHRRSKELKTEV